MDRNSSHNAVRQTGRIHKPLIRKVIGFFVAGFAQATGTPGCASGVNVTCDEPARPVLTDVLVVLVEKHANVVISLN
jgi:hypothetical protein